LDSPKRTSKSSNPDAKNGLLETLRKVRHRSPQPKFCPRCQGHNIYANQNFGLLPLTYRCRDCGYEGPLILELELEKPDSETAGKDE
jgi:predicted RNA-binding Zn-ribbon protein involved in translation (DUF1610 family)